MRILPDTHVLLWWLISPRRLTSVVYDQLGDPANTVFFSAVSIWEVAIKAALKRPGFAVSPPSVLQAARDSRLVEMPLYAAVALGVADLPLLHGDPFDRLLLVQARAEGCRLFTSDSRLHRYGDPVTPV